MSTPSRGWIVWVELLDPQGKNLKRRPAVILTPTEEITPGGSVTVAAISTQADLGTPGRQVALPWHREGAVKTGLREPCVAVADWLATVPLSAILGYAGVVSGRPLLDLLSLVPAPSPPVQPAPPASLSNPDE